MAELKTKPTDASVDAFLAAIPDDSRRQDCIEVRRMMTEATGAPAVMWGDSIVGFGQYSYQGASGSARWFLMGFSPRKNDLTLYLMTGLEPHREQLAALGKHKTGKACLYLKRLEDVNARVLGAIIQDTWTSLTTG